MKEPRIQYAKTSDGVGIAFHGEGKLLVDMAGWPWAHLRAAWLVPSYRLFHETLAAKCRLIRFDGRGTGLSDRNPADISLEARVRDVEAVVERLGLKAFDLVAWGPNGPAAILYATRHPDQVQHLILWDSSPHAVGTEAMEGTPRLAAIAELMSNDWELFTETTANVFLGWSAGEPARRFASFLRECVTPEMAVRAVGQALQDDVRSLVPRVSAPTLVLQHRDALSPTMDMASELTALMPNASLAVLDGTWITTDERAQKAAETILDFVSESPATARETSMEGTAVILFADIADSTALTERMGDAAFRETARALDDRLRAAIREAGGTPVEGKLLGDGLMAVFTSAAQAIDAARRCNAVSGESELRLRVGVHAGDVIREEGNIFGGAVNIASRVADAASPGEVLVSATVRDLARTSAGVAFEDRGERELKGVGEPVRVYEVRWRE